MLSPEWITLEEWVSYPADNTSRCTHRGLPFRQPVFGRTAFQTQAAVADGETILLGSCSTPDGEWVHAGFLTVRLQTGQPKLSGRPVDKVKPQGKERSLAVTEKLREMIIPEMTFRPPATIIDAVKFFNQASLDHDKPEVPRDQRGLSFVLKSPFFSGTSPVVEEPADPFAAPLATNEVPVISALSARHINLHDALKLVCDVTGMKFRIRDGVIWIEPQSLPDGELITRMYGSLQYSTDGFRVSRAEMEEMGMPPAPEPDLKSFFAQMGVNWPVGSSITNMNLMNGFRVTNTPENLAVFEQVSNDLSLRPSMVEVEVQMHAFRSEDIERLRLSDKVSVESLMALRQKGLSKPVASASVLTRAGQEAVMRCVREVTYPTELHADGGQTDLKGSSRDGAKALMPCNFEMREVGMILQVLPEISATDCSLVSLMLNSQWVTLDRWEVYPADLSAGWMHKTLPFRQPVFGVTSFQTQVTVADGGTVLLGNSATPDGKWVHVGFLTAKRVDVQLGDSITSP